MSRVNNETSKLIELYCEVGFEINVVEPRISKMYPKNYAFEQVLKTVPDFAFPLGQNTEKTLSPILYSFVLAGESSRFGFVRQEVGAMNAKVLLSFWPWHDIFFKLLNIFAELRTKVSDLEFENFTAMAINKFIPKEQNLLNLTFCDAKGFIIKELTFRRPIENEFPSILENHNLNLFFNYIKPETMVEIFAALLAERRIIFVSSNLDKLSSCVQASCSLLYPMSWQHVFIPILPIKLKDVLTGPMPYCIGCPVSVLSSMYKSEIGDAVIINCDENYVQNLFKDINEMPSEIVRNLKDQLSGPPSELCGNQIPKLFFHSLVQIIGGYRNALKNSDGLLTFDKKLFIRSHSRKSQGFAEKIVELQMFQQFLDERLKPSISVSDKFDDEVKLKFERKRSSFL